jgi:hypothetical protein
MWLSISEQPDSTHHGGKVISESSVQRQSHRAKPYSKGNREMSTKPHKKYINVEFSMLQASE